MVDVSKAAIAARLRTVAILSNLSRRLGQGTIVPPNGWPAISENRDGAVKFR